MMMGDRVSGVCIDNVIIVAHPVGKSNEFVASEDRRLDFDCDL